MHLISLLDLPESDPAIDAYIERVKVASGSTAELTRKDYLRPPPATSYRSLKPAGLSLQFEQPQQQQQQQEGGWKLAAIDLYNAPAVDKADADRSSNAKSEQAEWGTFPLLPLRLDVVTSSQVAAAAGAEAGAGGSKEGGPRRASLVISRETTAAELVRALGEPGRKGGGEATAGGGASGLGPAVWLEWGLEVALTAGEGDGGKEGNGKRFKLMVELAGKDARGAARWEADKAGKARWGVLTLSVA